jgi:hypothetical protein
MRIFCVWRDVMVSSMMPVNQLVRKAPTSGRQSMDLNTILTELRRERDQLNEAIAAIERLAASGGKRRRGRPPAWLSAARQGSEEQPVAKRRGRPRKKAGGE